MDQRVLVITPIPEYYGRQEIEHVFKKFDFTIKIDIRGDTAEIEFKNPISANKAYEAMKQNYQQQNMTLSFKQDPSAIEEPLMSSSLIAGPVLDKKGSTKILDSAVEGEEKPQTTRFPPIFSKKFLGLLLVCWAIYFYASHVHLNDDGDGDQIPAFVRKNHHHEHPKPSKNKIEHKQGVKGKEGKVEKDQEDDLQTKEGDQTQKLKNKKIHQDEQQVEEKVKQPRKNRADKDREQKQETAQKKEHKEMRNNNKNAQSLRDTKKGAVHKKAQSAQLEEEVEKEIQHQKKKNNRVDKQAEDKHVAATSAKKSKLQEKLLSHYEQEQQQQHNTKKQKQSPKKEEPGKKKQKKEKKDRK